MVQVVVTPAPIVTVGGATQVDVQVTFGGIQGPPGRDAQVSADEGNIITFGSDDGLFAPELTWSTRDW